MLSLLNFLNFNKSYISISFECHISNFVLAPQSDSLNFMNYMLCKRCVILLEYECMLVKNNFWAALKMFERLFSWFGQPSSIVDILFSLSVASAKH